MIRAISIPRATTDLDRGQPGFQRVAVGGRELHLLDSFLVFTYFRPLDVYLDYLES